MKDNNKVFICFFILTSIFFGTAFANEASGCAKCPKIEELTLVFQKFDYSKKEDRKTAELELEKVYELFEDFKKRLKKPPVNSAEFKALVALATEANIYDLETITAGYVQRLVTNSRELKMEWARLVQNLPKNCKWLDLQYYVLEKTCEPIEDSPGGKQPSTSKECKNRKPFNYEKCVQTPGPYL